MMSLITRWGKAFTKTENLQRWKRIQCGALTFALVVSFLPTQGLAVFAEELQPVADAEEQVAYDEPDLSADPSEEVEPAPEQEPAVEHDQEPTQDSADQNAAADEPTDQAAPNQGVSGQEPVTQDDANQTIAAQSPANLGTEKWDAANQVIASTVDAIENAEVAYAFEPAELPLDGTNIYKDGRTVNISITGLEDISDEQLATLTSSKLEASYIGLDNEATSDVIDLTWNYDEATFTLSSSAQLTSDGLYTKLALGEMVTESGEEVFVSFTDGGSTLELEEVASSADSVLQFIVDSSSPVVGSVDDVITEQTQFTNVDSWTLYIADASLELDPAAAQTTVVTVKFEDQDAVAINPSSSEGFLTLYTVDHAAQGAYAVTVSAYDKAGHAVAQSTFNYVVDKDVPEISTNFDEVTANATTTDEGIPYFTSNQAIVITVKDSNLDLDNNPIKVDGASTSADDWTIGVDEAGTTTYTCEIAYSADGLFRTPSVSVEDRAGNTAEDNGGSEFVMDLEGPKASTSFDDLIDPDTGVVAGYDENNIPYFIEAQTVTITITGRLLDSRAFVMYVDGEEYPDANWEQTGPDENKVVTYTCDVEYSVDGDHVSPAIAIEDYATREAKVEGTDFVLDSEGPSIVTDFDEVVRNYSVNTKSDDDPATDDIPFFTEDQTITVTVKGRNLTTEDITVDGEVLEADAWDVSEPDENKIATFTYKATYAEGNCTSPSVTVVNPITKSKATETGKAFVIDKSDPIVTVDFDDNPETIAEFADLVPDGRDADGTPYFTKDQTATITIVDRNLDMDSTAVTINGELVGDWEVSGPDADGFVTYKATHTYTENLDAGFHMTPVVSAVDYAKHATAEEGNKFYIDNTKPTIEFSYAASPDDVDNFADLADGKPSLDDVTYFDDVQQVTVIIKDRHLDLSSDQTSIIIDGKEIDGSLWTIGDPDTDGIVSYTYKHTYMESHADPDHTTPAVSAMDYAGLSDTKDEGKTFVVDRSEPIITTDYAVVVTDEMTGYCGKEPEYAQGDLGPVYVPSHENNPYFADDVQITVAITDRNLDFANSAMTINGNNIAVDPSSDEWTVSGPNENGAFTYTYTYTYSAKGTNTTPVVSVQDLAKRGAAQEGYEFVIDKTAPEVASVVVDSTPTSTGTDADSDSDPIEFFNQATSMSITLTDDYGLKGIVLDDPEGQYVLDDAIENADINNPTIEKTVTVDLVNGSFGAVDAEFERDITLTVTDIAGNWRSWTLNRQGEIQAVEEGSPDNAPVTIGGEGIYPYALILDTTNPEVELAGVAAGTYYNTPQTITATITEFNFAYLQRFDEARKIVNVSMFEGNSGRASHPYTIYAKDFSPSGNTWVYSEELGEGHYVIQSSFVDYANNPSNTASIEEFTVDLTDPTINVQWDNNDVQNTVQNVQYFNAGRTATITVVEHNFDPNLFTIDVTTENAEQGYAFPEYDSTAWETNGDTHVYTLAFGVDGEYDVTVTGKDLSLREAVQVDDEGNVIGTGYDSGTFVIDTENPTITTSGLQTPKDTDGNGIPYYDADQTFRITVKDRNLDRASSKVTISIDGSQQTSSLSDTQWTASARDADGYVTYTRDYTYTENATSVHVTPVLEVIDYANRTAQLAGEQFIIDETDPVIYTTYESVVQANQTGSLGNPAVPYFAADQTVEVYIVDRHLKLSESTITIDNTSVPTSSWTTSNGENGNIVYYYKYTYAEGVHTSPVVSVIDYAKRTAKVDGKSFVIDKTAPEVASVTVNSTPSNSGSDANTGGDPIQFFNQATKMDITLTDKYGLKNIVLDDPENQYVIQNPFDNSNTYSPVTNWTITVNLADGASNLQNDTEFERNITLTVTDIAGNWRTWSISRTGKIQAVAEGTAANTPINGGNVYPYALIEDTMSPTIALSGVTEGRYYNSPQTVTAVVNEFNFDYLQRFDGMRSIARVTQTAGDYTGSKETRDIYASQFVGSGSNWSYDEVLSSDGHYEIEAYFNDFADNPSNPDSIGEFTIDMTSPKITVEWDNNDALNGKYYKATRTATITVTEHNFDPERFTITTTGTLKSDWVTDGDDHTIVYFFDEAASHSLSVSGSDLAGNEAIEFVEPEFVVDLTAPTITIGGRAQRTDQAGSKDKYDGVPKDKNAYNGVVAPTITFADEQNFDNDLTEFSLSGNAHGIVATGEEGDEFENENPKPRTGALSKTVTFKDFGSLYGDELPKNAERNKVWDASADDIYTITASMTDLAGNEASEEITISVNRFGSNYIIEVMEEGETKPTELDGAGMLDSSPEITVTEINVSGAKSEDDHEVSMQFKGLTNSVPNMEIERDDNGSGTGYRLDADEQDKTGWAEYTYTIRRANFGENGLVDTGAGDKGQGEYQVVVNSEDRANNKNQSSNYWNSDEDNRAGAKLSKDAPIIFTLDEIAPVIEQVDLPQNFAQGEEYKASFTVTDDFTDGDTIEVFVNDEKVDVYYQGSDEVVSGQVGEGTYEFTIPASSFKFNNVKISVKDYAGREAEPVDVTVYVSTLIAEGIAVVAVLAVVAGVVVIVRKKAGRKAVEEPAA